MKNLVLILIIILIHITLSAQTVTLPTKTIEGITNKMLEIISGEIGEERDWKSFRNLFLPTAQITSTRKTKDGETRTSVMNLDEFIHKIGPLYARDGFEEYSIGLAVNEFNGIANVFQSYYCKNLIGTFENKGINSYQLVYKENRWWISNTLFTSKIEGSPIPEKYLFNKDQSENTISENHSAQTSNSKNPKIVTFLTFQDNNAENAMNFYVELFENSKIIEVKRWAKEIPSQEGKIMHATFDLNGQRFMCSDSPPVHDWDFSPAVSNYINCENESELERLFEKLAENGKVTMPLNNYGFSQKFGWVIDQFGISWQLNLQ